MEPMEIQIGDNANLIVIPTLCLSALFLTSTQASVLLKYMLFWAIFYYFWLRFLHLRFCKKCFYTTNRVDNIVNYLWGIPLSVVAVACVQWGFRAKILLGADVPEEEQQMRIWLKNGLCVLAFATSLALWLATYHWVIDPWNSDPHTENELECMTVQECKENNTFYSWFNCNPVFTLKCEFYWHDDAGNLKDSVRTKHPIASGEDPEKVRFFSVGKEYLFLKPDRQHMAFPQFRHHGRHGDLFEFETYLEGLLAFLMSLVPTMPTWGRQPVGKQPVPDARSESELVLLQHEA
eukprot:SRR837773.9965.p1 GENE.SRR837773.9965~~SRR837773.9965.p1  ORF type:complete len:305 (+),score=22.38 SRR837773.9965:42-917(+)